LTNPEFGSTFICAMEQSATRTQTGRSRRYPGIDLETAITIRTLVLKDGVAHIQVGAGIVADSDPPTEYQETLNKANAVLAAVAEAERMESFAGPLQSPAKLEVVA